MWLVSEVEYILVLVLPVNTVCLMFRLLNRPVVQHQAIEQKGKDDRHGRVGHYMTGDAIGSLALRSKSRPSRAGWRSSA